MSGLKKLHPVWDGGHFVRDRDDIRLQKFARNLVGWAHWCPGCRKMHVLHVKDYEFSGEKEKPTVRPACIFPKLSADGHHCVYMIQDGRIYFGRECTHRFAGVTVAMKEWSPEESGAPELPGQLAS